MLARIQVQYVSFRHASSGKTIEAPALHLVANSSWFILLTGRGRDDAVVRGNEIVVDCVVIRGVVDG